MDSSLAAAQRVRGSSVTEGGLPGAAPSDDVTGSGGTGAGGPDLKRSDLSLDGGVGHSNGHARAGVVGPERGLYRAVGSSRPMARYPHGDGRSTGPSIVRCTKM